MAHSEEVAGGQYKGKNLESNKEVNYSQETEEGLQDPYESCCSRNLALTKWCHSMAEKDPGNKCHDY